MPTILCFKEHSEDGLVWWVRHRGKWRTTGSVVVSAPFRTVYRGKGAKQPTAFCEFIGEVRVEGRDRGKSMMIAPVDLMQKHLAAMDRYYAKAVSRARREAR